MGVGGRFWDLLKPYARSEGPDFLRDKRVAVDLSYWIVQHDAAIRSRAPRARSPHLRTTFFRTVALFAKMGAFPVFVVDGEPSPLKAQARIERFLRGSGVDSSAIAPAGVEGGEVPVKKRNSLFERYVRECVELLELLGMPVIQARSEAEALCAQLNREGQVNACITADSDAFLFGATCVIKCFQSNSKEPFECYHLADVEAGLGLRRKQLVAIALLVGNDHDLGGVSGFGVDTAVRFVKLFNEDEIMNRLAEIGRGVFPLLQDDFRIIPDTPSSDDRVMTAKPAHCSHCGHPGSKRAHLKIACEHCVMDGSQNCIEKPAGFRCKCSSCNMAQKSKEQKKHENWQIKFCKKIAEEHNFPNREIIDMYLCCSHQCESNSLDMKWNEPNVGDLVDFLAYHLSWEPTYIRQRVLPMLSTVLLRKMASIPDEPLLLCDQYEFHSILRVKIRYGHSCYLVKWKKAGLDTNVGVPDIPLEQPEAQEGESTDTCDFIDLTDESDVPQILIDDGTWYMLTEENMELVQAAFPDVVDRFLEDKRIKESARKPKKTSKTQAGNCNVLETPKSKAVQLSITQFYRSAKSSPRTRPGDDPGNSSCGKEKSKKSRKKSVDFDAPCAKRRLLFD